MQSTEAFWSKKNFFQIAGFLLIGGLSFFYSLYHRNFAEISIQLLFLNFPVFIGEIFMAVCLICLWLDWRIKKVQFNKWHGLIGLFFLWILVKALWGYLTGGPLAFRHAALFYYSSFAVMGYYFYSPRFFTQPVLVFLCLLMIAVFFYMPKAFLSYDRLPYLALFTVLWLKIHNQWIKGGFLILCILSYPFFLFFQQPRTLLLAMSATIIVFVCIYLFFFLNMSRLRKFLLFLLILTAMASAVLQFADRQRLQFFVSINQLKVSYNEKKRFIEEHEADFKFKDVKPNVYNDEKGYEGESLVGFAVEELTESASKISENRAELKDKIRGVFERNFNGSFLTFSRIVTHYAEEYKQKKMIALEARDAAFKETEAAIEETLTQIQDEFEKEIFPDLSQDKIESIKIELRRNAFTKLRSMANYTIEINIAPLKSRSLVTEHENVLFRIFIWEDMIRELIQQRAWGGVAFEHPQRSKQAEILEYAKAEWLRDGWITPHNSFLHMIYRGGIIGSVFVLFIFGLVYKMTKHVIEARSLTGLILLCVLINWTVMAFCLVILELPYNAIVYWSFLGMTLAYCHQQKLIQQTA